MSESEVENVICGGKDAANMWKEKESLLGKNLMQKLRVTQISQER